MSNKFKLFCLIASIVLIIPFVYLIFAATVFGYEESQLEYLLKK